jgi:tetratricopeptide (TPR) repeat protein
VNLFYPTAGTLVVLAIFGVFVGRQNRDLLRARAYGEFFVRLVPLLSTGVFIAGLPFVMDLARFENAGTVLLVYLAGAALLTIVTARAVAPEERRASAAFRRGEPEKAVEIYEDLADRRPLPRYYSALAAARDASGHPHAALEAADRAIKLDPKLGIAYYNRASALAALGESPRARSDLQTVFRTDSGRTLRRAAERALETLDKS